MDKKYILLVIIALLTACSAANDKVNEKFDLLKSKADHLDSIVNAEAVRVQQLDTIIFREFRKIRQLDSIIELEKEKWVTQ